MKFIRSAVRECTRNELALARRYSNDRVRSHAEMMIRESRLLLIDNERVLVGNVVQIAWEIKKYGKVQFSKINT